VVGFFGHRRKARPAGLVDAEEHSLAKGFPRTYNVIGEEAQKEPTVALERGPASDLAPLRFVLLTAPLRSTGVSALRPERGCQSSIVRAARQVLLLVRHRRQIPLDGSMS